MSGQDPSDKVTITLTRQQATQLLGRLMSDISEDAWCAGWMMGVEDDLPALCRNAVKTGKPVSWGQSVVTLPEAQIAVAFADALGHWADLNPDVSEGGYVPYTPKDGS